MKFTKAMGPQQCTVLPFIHSLSGRDITSYPYFIGKKSWLAASKLTDIENLEDFADEAENVAIADKLKNQARDLLIVVYTKKIDMMGSSLAQVRTNKFLNNRSTLLKLLPPTEGAFKEHLKLSALAVAIDKQSHIAKPILPCLDNYGWTVKDANLVPVLTKEPLWPPEMTKSVSYGCTKRCTRNCSCAKKDVQCYVGCGCTG